MFRIGMSIVLSLLPTFAFVVLATLQTTVSWAVELPTAVPASVRSFLNDHCLACHEGNDGAGGLNLTALQGNLNTPGELARWIRILDRVQAGEMPPKDAVQPPRQETAAFAESTSSWLVAHQREQWRALGRVRGRRLTNLQIERTLHDLLGIDIPLANLLPEEPRTSGFTTVADGQPMSHFQLQQHLMVVDAALDEAFRRAGSSNDEWQNTFSAKALARNNPQRPTREPELIDGMAVTWSGRLVFYGRLPATTAKADGWYRFKIRASALKIPPAGGVWCTVRSGQCVSSAPLLGWVGAFEAREKPNEWTFETWLPKGHMIEVKPGDVTLKSARFANGQVATGEGGPQDVPGVAIDSIVMERFHQGPGNWLLRKSMFGELKLQPGNNRKPAVLLSETPQEDSAVLMRQFAQRAFRRPVTDDEVAPYVAMVHADLDQNVPLLDALRGGYRALLCSPRFLYFHETPGELDGYAMASRLSYFLWNTMPDAPLLKQAEAGRIGKPWAIRQEVERMLADPRGRRFIRDFAAEWLDLSLIDFTEPDPKRFREFDVIVQQSMLDETHTFLQTMIDENLSVGHLIVSDFTYLNSRLARFYRVDGVTGDDLRRTPLKPEHHRGGLLTQGAILKVTANGSTTSPVIRGLWVSERLLGVHVPPPPENVPAIEPDIRGATSIREMLAKHRAEDSCASCHVKIDPPGFALENYDPAGQWRDQYLAVKRGKPSREKAIDASYELPDGRHFDDIRQFQKLIRADTTSVARNVAEKLITYGTGAPITFADRQAVEEVVARSAESDFGFRSLVEAVASNAVFL
ncbi:MAG: DUF1592 domain-containing protein, partial [Planctomycetota bacterium]|nr:DUF1592 domain-containing protein [Planctomycetota bacterium]